MFHVFAGVNAGMEDCKQLENKYHNFKVFYGTPHEELLERISEYDYGCLLSTGGKLVAEMETHDGLYYGSSYINAVTNKYFDYIDAGIPVIAKYQAKLCEFLEQYGILVRMDITDIDIDYLLKNREVYREKVKEAKKDLLIDNQIGRLIDFLEEL